MFYLSSDQLWISLLTHATSPGSTTFESNVATSQQSSAYIVLLFLGNPGCTRIGGISVVHDVMIGLSMAHNVLIYLLSLALNTK